MRMASIKRNAKWKQEHAQALEAWMAKEGGVSRPNEDDGGMVSTRGSSSQ